MKNFVLTVVIVGFVAAGAFFIINKLQGQLDASTFEQKRAAAHTESARQLAVAIQAPDDKVAFEQKQIVSGFDKRMKEILTAHPKFADEDAFMKERDKKLKDGKITDPKKVDEYRERFEWLKERYGVLSAPTYKPLLSGYQNGLRMDIVAITKSNEGGKQSLKMDLFYWGALGEQLTFNDIEIQFVREISEDGKKPKKALAKVQGGGPPYIIHHDAEDWLMKWPPAVAPAYYVGFPLFAPDATVFTMTMRLNHRTNGGTQLPIEFKFENVEVDPTWRAPEGSTWDAEVMEATEEELKAAGIE